MGCDISLIVQTKRDGEWKTEKWPNPWFSNDAAPLEFEEDREPEFTARYPFKRRYSTFAILANVRNAHAIVPIAEPRGLPEPVAVALNSEGCLNVDGESVWLGDFAFSWLEYEEIANPSYWCQTATVDYFVSETEYARMLREEDAPREWTHALAASNHREISEAEMYFRLFALEAERTLLALADEEAKCYVKIRRAEPYTKLGEQLYAELLPKLAELMAQEGVENVRIIFGFDQ